MLSTADLSLSMLAIVSFPTSRNRPIRLKHVRQSFATAFVQLLRQIIVGPRYHVEWPQVLKKELTLALNHGHESVGI